MTIKKKLIGYGYTDSNGVATLDYNENGTEISTLAPTGSSGYIGRGVGNVQLEAGLHNSEAVVSGTYPVLDCVFLDVATTGLKNSYWYKENINTPQTTDEGTTISESGNGSSYLIATVENTTTWSNRRYFDVDFAIEFDIDNVANTNFIFYCTGVTGAKQSYLEDGHYKFLVTSTGITGYKDGVAFQNPIYTGALTTVNCGFNDASSSATMSFRYKNFKIYPI